jgi:hypothetical protein
MLTSPSSVQAAQLRTREFLVEAEQERLVRQAEGTVKVKGAPQPALITAIRYTRYLLASLAAIAFGLTGN